MMWIGWLPEQQFRRLHPIANNTRFVLLRGGEPGLSGVGDERSSFKVLTALDPDALDRAARAWAAQHASREEPVAIDGKHCRAGPRD